MSILDLHKVVGLCRDQGLTAQLWTDGDVASIKAWRDTSGEAWWPVTVGPGWTVKDGSYANSDDVKVIIAANPEHPIGDEERLCRGLDEQGVAALIVSCVDRQDRIYREGTGDG